MAREESKQLKQCVLSREQLRQIIAAEEPRFRALSDEFAAARPGGSPSWSRKQELGHLIDSATNNRVRFVKAALEGQYVGPTYDGSGWVELAGYAEMAWTTLIDRWKAQNLFLVALLSRIPPERLSAMCSVGGGDPVTLEFLIDDYMRHMQHHLDHILGPADRAAAPGAMRAV